MTNKLRVLHITPMYPNEKRPSFGVFVKTQIDSLRPYVDIDTLILPGLQGIWPYLKSIGTIRRKLRGSYDLIHVHYGNVSSLVKMLYYGRVPIVTSYCGDDLLGTVMPNGKNTIKSTVFMYLNAWLSRRDAYSIVKSEELGSKISARVRHLQVIPNGVDITKFKPIDRQEARNKIGVATNGVRVFTFPANPDIPRKNFVFLQRVLDSMVGREQYKMLVFRDGQVSHDLVPYYLNAADAVVLTSLVEGSPNVVKEAMACDARIFSSDCGDVSWLLEGVKGSAVLPLDEDVWRENLKPLFDAEPSAVASNARQKLLERELDLDAVAKKIVGIYEQVTQNVKS